MCDLWKNTLTESVPPGAIAAQIDYALNALEKNRRPGFQRGGSAGILSADPELAAGNPLDRQAGVQGCGHAKSNSTTAEVSSTGAQSRRTIIQPSRRESGASSG